MIGQLGHGVMILFASDDADGIMDTFGYTHGILMVFAYGKMLWMDVAQFHPSYCCGFPESCR